MKSKKANLTLYIVFSFVALLVLLVASVVAPLGIRISSESFAQGEKIINASYDRLNSVTDSAIKTEIMANLNAARTSTSDNIEIFSVMFKYAWFFVLLIAALIIFLIARSVVETPSRIA